MAFHGIIVMVSAQEVLEPACLERMAQFVDLARELGVPHSLYNCRFSFISLI
jgi:hypothetical protein